MHALKQANFDPLNLSTELCFVVLKSADLLLFTIGISISRFCLKLVSSGCLPEFLSSLYV